MAEERTKYGLEIPALGSLILTHSLNKQVPALKDFPKEDRPNSLIVFWSFRIMVGMGVLMIALLAYGPLAALSAASLSLTPFSGPRWRWVQRDC